MIKFLKPVVFPGLLISGVAACYSGVSLAPLCGNGAVDPGETCDIGIPEGAGKCAVAG